MSENYQSAFPDDGQDQLGDAIAVEHPNPVTIVDESVLEGLDNAVENSEVPRRVEFDK